jgi:flavin-dependent dehydrogenase
LTGECRQLLSELGLDDYMSSAGFPIKRGVSVSGENDASRFWVPVEGLREDGSRFLATTWQVRRDEFDAKLLDTAIENGAGFLRARVVGVEMEDGRVSGVKLSGGAGVPQFLKAKTVADCSGQHSVFSKLKLTSPKLRTGYENQVAFYAQLTGVVRDEAPNAESTHIFYGKRHHWAWAIPLNDDITSVGVVLPKQSLGGGKKSAEEIFKATLHNVNPELIARTQDDTIQSEIYTTTNYSYKTDHYTGPGFLCVGDSHRFLDPIFSFGVLISLQEAKLAAQALDLYLDDPVAAGPEAFADYAHRANRAQKVVEYIIRTFWDYPLAFLKLAHFSNSSDIAEIFSGRLYSDNVEDIPAVDLMRQLLAKSEQMAS